MRGSARLFCNTYGVDFIDHSHSDDGTAMAGWVEWCISAVKDPAIFRKIAGSYRLSNVDLNKQLFERIATIHFVYLLP
jgi:hypothetical protein